MILKETRLMADDSLGCKIVTQAIADYIRARLSIGTCKTVLSLYGDDPVIAEIARHKIKEARTIIREIEGLLGSEWLKTMKYGEGELVLEKLRKEAGKYDR